MGFPRRVFIPNVSHHVIRRGVNRCAIVADDEDRLELLRALRDASEGCDVQVHGFILMTTHYHLVVTPLREKALSLMLKAANERYVPYFNARHGRIGTLWTCRPRCIPLMDDRRWLTCLRYVEQNAWRAKMVAAPGDYRWSSYGFHALGEPSDWLVAHALYLGLGVTPKERQAVYRAICGQSLTGDELFEQRHPKRVSAQVPVQAPVLDDSSLAFSDDAVAT